MIAERFTAMAARTTARPANRDEPARDETARGEKE
jgi:hypothetical protein